jgi:hypothetical protein
VIVSTNIHKAHKKYTQFLRQIANISKLTFDPVRDRKAGQAIGPIQSTKELEENYLRDFTKK